MTTSARILVVDDEPDILWGLRYALGDEGYTVDTAPSGEEAWEIVAKQRPDLALLDVAMPGMDGFELCRRLRRDVRFASVPVIFLTATRDMTNCIKGLDEGGDDYLNKPFDLGELKARIRAVLRRSGHKSAAEPDASPVLEASLVHIDPRTKSLEVRGAPVAVTPAELALVV